MNRLTQIVAAVFCTLLASPVAAQEAAKVDVNELIDVVAEAYGGAALTQIENYQITERYVAPATGQSWTPDMVNVGYTNQKFVYEVGSGKVYFENWFGGRSGVFPNVVISDGNEAHAINLQSSSYGDAASVDPYVIAGGTMRTTDTLLALELIKQRDKAQYVGAAMFLNREHQLVTIPFPQSPELTLYIDSETHLINRMTRDNPQLGLLDYVFSDHEEKNGIVRATNVNFSVAGDPNLIGTRHDVQFNVALADDRFAMPAGLEQEGARINGAEMVVNRLAKNVYHIGQNGAYSIFVDTGREIVGCGGYAGLSQRLAQFREETGSHLPLGYQVVSHHHVDHLGGMPEALDLGATLVTVSANIAPITEAAQREVESGRFLTVNERITLGEGSGRVEIYDVSTLHSVSNLLVYVPSARTVFMADHLNSPYEEGVPTANANTVSMDAALQDVDIGFKKIVTAHGPRVFSASDFSASVKAYRDYDCPDDRPLCSR
jgi:glyoxylase-like metal-dependent hydrolase (beta-lactamase superfamily II)